MPKNPKNSDVSDGRCQSCGAVRALTGASTYDDVRGFLSWVAGQLINKVITDREAKALEGLARATVATSRTKSSESELDDLRALVERAEQAHIRRLGVAAQQRHGGGADTVGVWEVAPDGATEEPCDLLESSTPKRSVVSV